MATKTPNDLVLTRMGRRRLAELAAKAKRLGTTPERYVKRLVAADLDLDREARTTPLAGLMGRRTDLDDAELDRLVEEAREDHYRRRTARKR